MINKEELLNYKEFYKSFKNGEDLTSFFNQMHKRAIEHILNAKLDAYLDNEKHEKTKTGNYLNRHGKKKIKPPLVRLKWKFKETDREVLNRKDITS